MKQWLGLDVRSLGLLRIGVGAVLLVDILLRSFHFRAHYTSQGVLPLRLYLQQPDLSFRLWSVYYLNDSPLLVAGFMLVAGLAALALMVGYRTAAAGWISWVMLLSLHHRNPIVLHKGDAYLGLILFWGCLLPWGEAFALGRTRQEYAQPLRLSFGTVGLVAQVCLLYWFSAVYRTDPVWAVDGSALYYTLHLDADLTPLAPYLLSRSDLITFLSHATIYLEAFGPFLLLLPFAVTRVVSVLLIASFHLGIIATLNIGLFGVICAVVPLAFLPTSVWKTRFGRRTESGLGKLFERFPNLGGQSHDGILPSRARELLGLFALLCVVYYSFAELYGRDPWAPEMRGIKAMGWNQRWGMFSPSPPKSSSLQAIEAITQSGRRVDLLEGSSGLTSQRWRFYRSNLNLSGFGPHARAYLTYLVERWDQRHPEDPVLRARYLVTRRRTQPDYQLGLVRTVVIGEFHR